MTVKYIIKNLIIYMLFIIPSFVSAQGVGIITMDMMILPGTSSYLKSSIERAEKENLDLLVVNLNTPGGMLISSQQMIESLFKSKVPVVIYVTPSGGTAASAGVFITMAGHIAAMAPGTSIGAAHPVSGDGKDIEGDMRLKAENLTIAMVRSVAEQRGRNIAWAEKAVRESSSLTEKEALSQKVIDIIATDIEDLLKQLKDRKIKVGEKEITLGDYTKSPKILYEMPSHFKALNLIAQPTVAGILWLIATTGIAAELYHPGLILPGVVGAIALILALIVSQSLPLQGGAIALIVLGGFLIGAELFITSGLLALGGIISIGLGLFYLVDVNQGPDLKVAFEYVIPVAVVIIGFFLSALVAITRTRKKPLITGFESLIGKEGIVVKTIDPYGKISINGEIWSAKSENESIFKGEQVSIVDSKHDTLQLIVTKLKK